MLLRNNSLLLPIRKAIVRDSYSLDTHPDLPFKSGHDGFLFLVIQ